MKELATVAGPGIFGLLGLFFLYTGYLIRFRQKLNLLAGYDATRVRDTKELSHWAGNHVLRIGALFLIGAISFTINPSTFPILLVFVGTILITISMVRGSSKFYR
ncbi:hypothetical protein PK28_06085 [Hymenobacter sp. DG25B]|uniref:DUF3784 domain-containing protein n=1 Tax=Hymenobacter sp. DG25B TaxID=1385664 RepID=UPI000540BA0D|nr:DUF3784 domain-containing protein [Hymenobacter sp. DG25B]AIZ63372.1 hypothetical protein PK28_06085 [Hymenobacter sp. DG25B]